MDQQNINPPGNSKDINPDDSINIADSPEQNKTFVLAGDFTGNGFHNVLMIQQSGETVCCWLIDKQGNASLESAFKHPPGWEPFRVCDVNSDGKQELLWKHDNGSMISTVVIERQTNDCQIRIDMKRFFGAGAQPEFNLSPIDEPSQSATKDNDPLTTASSGL
ncbi:MAG: hypothetical protein SGI98_08580 [Verrucomicrobiota bacterium]|nr:hypothetical protein [Verrucomicrobiota bacterium]